MHLSPTASRPGVVDEATPSSTAPALSVRGATIGYGRRPVVHAADLTVQRGEAVALLGANGSGKSTLVRGILGLADILAGHVDVLGEHVEHGASSAASLVGYVPQRHSVSGAVPSTAAEVVGSGLLASRGFWRPPRRADRSRVLEALAEVGLADRARARVAELSGGQQRRVLIARALVSGPQLLVLDEPTAGVDRVSTEALVHTLGQLKTGGRALLVVTHDLDELGDVPDRAVTMKDGSVLSDTAMSKRT
ncbi:metal ABC transporter ATP-binding protein [Aquipuribacter sp. MA13-6]|uniref:metal ABC transporter ATP-binding protein n=1 Tax=unclassified Aquipuribacter TaxID=2635084 RepID=UPI003EF030C8